jgi:inhibitor of KinA
VQRHSSAMYRVTSVGFTPGFPYLSGLPAALATPRRSSPRKEIPAGAVGIGGTQTGIYPRKSPGGWNIIGRTPLSLFEVKREPPALLRAGDRVRFRRITREEFEKASA